MGGSSQRNASKQWVNNQPLNVGKERGSASGASSRSPDEASPEKYEAPNSGDSRELRDDHLEDNHTVNQIGVGKRGTGSDQNRKALQSQTYAQNSSRKFQRDGRRMDMGEVVENDEGY